MNATPRFYNRFFLLLCGLLLVGSGALVVATQFSTAVEQWWQALVAQWQWSTVVALGIIAVVLIMAVILVASQGGGRRTQVIQVSAATATPGAVAINVSLINDLLSELNERQPDIGKLTVSCFQAGNDRALRIRTQLRNGASPTHMAEEIENKLADIDRRLGQQVPRVIELVSGIRTVR